MTQFLQELASIVVELQEVDRDLDAAIDEDADHWELLFTSINVLLKVANTLKTYLSYS
jgi:hypothetical protein